MPQIKIFLLVCLGTMLIGCQKETKSLYKTSVLQDGFPEILKPLEKDLPFELLSQTHLESNNDSIDIYFGSLKQGNQKGNWIALASNKKIKQFSTVDLEQNPENEKENDIDLEFNNATNRISLRIKEFDTIINSITYSWINKTTLTDSLTVITIDKPLAKGKTFPFIKFTDRNGNEINLENFKDQTIVINWWAVWCTPCRKEIPGLNKLVNKYSDKNVKFVSITDDSVDRVSNFLKEHEFLYDITFISENDRVLFGNSYPKHIVIDSNKTITFYKEGGNEFFWEELDRHLTVLQAN
ncbi:thiol:disulfide interchange protein TlpA [Formosa agariphila KMM 3901]|uniref:Thiol:disulfide interchange protein TlpA n=1 Tax=Formosa agariphila (strain DSM 15362 / KCTC 12365 / LMG 23005 / KMM 3901 / M-2Alg 35-1) TaxID=1347342 RepID=T2KM30_FORAG|nr:TlpA disulfide reductase family protein [Formosa agariphila]CDF79059.1 thiol:disulfide interchange protein TlpA [Formosa agariphila KMM 3901]